MAFIVLLLASLSTLVKVENQTSTAFLQQLRAREAARFALMVAIAETQKHAGPDQRITARAEVLSETDEAIKEDSRFWTGVWDTTKPEADPVWLVSGESPSPVKVEESHVFIRQYDDAENRYDRPSTMAPLQQIGEDIQVAWWVSDNGVQAPVRIIEGINGKPLDYLGYNEPTIRNAQLAHDSAFDFHELFDLTNLSNKKSEQLQKTIHSTQLKFFADDLSLEERNRAISQLSHAVVLNNAFVLSNPLEGGLKKDLSYLKTINLESTDPQQNPATLYSDPDYKHSTLFQSLAELMQFQANPSVVKTDDVIGMQLDANQEILDPNALPETLFNLAPVVTEFQLLCGVVGDNNNLGFVGLVHKLYIELWNPYTIPFRIGDKSMPEELGYSDLTFEISNLPDYVISKFTFEGSPKSGSIPLLKYQWSEYADPKTLRPGMVFQQAFPRDSEELELEQNTPGYSGYISSKYQGVRVQQLGAPSSGPISLEYTNDFSFPPDRQGPLLSVKGWKNGISKEIFRAELSNYPDFSITHEESNPNRFLRTWTSKGETEGIGYNSLETGQWSFGFHFKLLDEQRAFGDVKDLSNWLQLRDIRHPILKADISRNISTAWDPPMLPYEFKEKPENMQPSLSFSANDFFHYNQDNRRGRRDRIARFFDFPTGEITEPSILRSIQYLEDDVRPNGVGNPWGGHLNKFYDRYFFSTLPPSPEEENEIPRLANSRIFAYKEMPELTGIGSAENLLIRNGFNFNSTSPLAWEKVLWGQNYAEDQLLLRVEQANYSGGKPKWKNIAEKLKHVFVNHPQTSAYNLIEKDRDTESRYGLVTQDAIQKDPAKNSYLGEFSTRSPNWQNKLQHPAFYQPLRELESSDIRKLSEEIVTQLKQFSKREKRPVFSMAEFLNKGILQKAIDAVPGINDRENGRDGVPRHSPASITQATLMNMLGSSGFVRSDTFEIHAYARVINPVTGALESEVTCSAHLQRVPKAHEDTSFGRKFKIVNFQWNSINE